MSDRLESLRGSMKVMADYESARDRGFRHMREKLNVMLRHLEMWNAAAEQAGSTENCPLAPVIAKYCQALGETPPGKLKPDPSQPAPAQKKAAAKGKGKGRGKGKKADPSSQQPPPPADGEGNGQNGGGGDDANPAEDDSGKNETGDGLGALPLPAKGHWLNSHEEILARELPEVKSTAADMKKYLAAKRAFLKRNLPKLRAYIKEPRQGKSPLFTYCALFQFDTGDLPGALKTAAEAIRLQQPSAIKRDFHQISADLRKEHLEREAEKVAKSGARGKAYGELRTLRDDLMNNPHRHNHWKAGVCKTFGSLALALGDFQVALDNLNAVKFLDPNMGVETLLEKAKKGLASLTP